MIRAAVKLGLSGLLRVIALVVLVVSVGWVLGPYRPDLRDPASIGSDSSNYYAAGQRLNAGHHLYMLGSGDRPVANGTAPSPWSVPLLSPPPIAVVWRVLALLPGDASMYLWWASGAIAALLFYVFLIFRLPARQLIIAILLAPCLSITAVSGNVNAFLIPLSGAVWSLGGRDRSTAAGAIVGVMGAIKLAPALFLWWFICERKDRAVIATVATLMVAALVTILGAGWAAIASYPAVAAEANSVGLGPFSPTMVASAIGVPGSIAPIAPYGIAIASCLIAFAVRRRPGWAFAACVVGVTLGTPSVRFETLAWLLVALVPWVDRPNGAGVREPRVAGSSLVSAGAIAGRGAVG